MEQNPMGQGGQQQPVQPPQKSSNKTVLIIIIVVVVLGAVVLAGGYFAMKYLKTKVSQKIGQKIGENMMEKAIEQSTGKKADVSADGKTVSIKTDNGTMAASGEGTINLPADFPSDVFVYPDAKITFSTSTPTNAADGTKASFMLAYGIGQSVSDVVTKYKDEMAKNSWTKETEANYGAMMVNFKKDSREIVLTVTKNQDGKSGSTVVSITGSEN